MKNIVCPCCGKRSIQEFINYPKLPEILFPVDYDVRNVIEKYDLQLYFCSFCSHIFQAEVDTVLNQRIYRELYKYYPFDDIESFQETYRRPFNKLFDSVLPGPAEGRRLLEIGCSSLEAMKVFREKGFECVGVDPASETVKSGKITIVGEPYEKVRFDNKFNAVVARFVFEHVVDLDIFLDKLKGDIEDNGQIFIQVPNILNFIKWGILCIGAHEHIQYFSRESLITLLKRHGFEVIAVCDKEMPSLLGCFRRTVRTVPEQSPEPADIAYTSFREIVGSAAADLRNILAPCRRICFYGAGLQLMWLLYLSGIDLKNKEITVADDNLLLHNRYLPATDYSVVPLSKEALACSDAVVLSLSSIYYSRAAARIKALSGSDKRIIAFESGSWKIISSQEK